MCDYRELRPERSLAPYVACFWTRSIEERAADLRPRILPDGCVDVVWLGQAAPEVAGPATRAAHPTLSPGQTIVGPLVVEEFGSTTVVFPSQTLTVDPHGILIIRAEGGEAGR